MLPDGKFATRTSDLVVVTTTVPFTYRYENILNPLPDTLNAAMVVVSRIALDLEALLEMFGPTEESVTIAGDLQHAPGGRRTNWISGPHRQGWECFAIASLLNVENITSVVACGVDEQSSRQTCGEVGTSRLKVEVMNWRLTIST
jgi:hypothetical protein